RFHCHASGDRFRQYGFAVRGILLVERIGRWHRNHTRFHAFSSQFFPCGNGQFNFRTGRDEDQLRLACAIFQHVTTARDVCQLLWGTLLLRQVLTGEDQCGRAIMTLNAVFPRHRRFNLVTWTPCAHVRGHAQRSHLLYWLVGRTVFAQTDRVVGVDHHLTLFHQRSHTHGVTCIFHKHQESRGVRQETTVQSDTVGNRGHPEFTYTVMDVVTGSIFVDWLRSGPQGQV